MIEHEFGWLYRPVMRGLIGAESYINGTIDLAEVTLLNELIDIENANERKLRDYYRNG